MRRTFLNERLRSIKNLKDKIMGRYMKVILKAKHKNDRFIDRLNWKLTEAYAANTTHKFNPWHYLQQEADYMNTNPEGLKQLPHWERPITPHRLSSNFFWLTHGEFHFKLSGEVTSDEARDAIAVAKWVAATDKKYINSLASDNYDLDTVKQYINNIMKEDGYDLKKLWQIT